MHTPGLPSPTHRHDDRQHVDDDGFHSQNPSLSTDIYVSDYPEAPVFDRDEHYFEAPYQNSSPDTYFEEVGIRDPDKGNGSAGLPFLLLPLRLFIFVAWFRSSAEKLVSSEWWSGAELSAFFETYEGMGLWRPLERVVASSSAGVGPFEVIVLFVPFIQAFIAAGLLSNRTLKAALWTAMFMNLCFIVGGRVNPSIFYMLIQITLILFLVNSGGQSNLRLELRNLRLWIAGALLALALGLVAFARTFDIQAAKDDPALALSTVAFLLAVGLLAPLWEHFKQSKRFSVDQETYYYDDYMSTGDVAPPDFEQIADVAPFEPVLEPRAAPDMYAPPREAVEYEETLIVAGVRRRQAESLQTGW